MLDRTIGGIKNLLYGEDTNTLRSATVQLGNPKPWAEELNISEDESYARTFAHEIISHIKNYTYQGGTEVEHERIKEFDKRLEIPKPKK